MLAVGAAVVYLAVLARYAGWLQVHDPILNAGLRSLGEHRGSTQFDIFLTICIVWLMIYILSYTIHPAAVVSICCKYTVRDYQVCLVRSALA